MRRLRLICCMERHKSGSCLISLHAIVTGWWPPLREDKGFEVYCMQVCCCLKSRLSLIVRVNVILNRTVVVDSD